MSWRPSPLTWLALRWPRDVQPDQLTAACRMLATSAGSPVVLQAVGTTEHVEHFLAVPAAKAAGITAHLRTTLPGLGIDDVTDPNLNSRPRNHAIRLSFTTRRRPLRTDDPEQVSRALLTALAHVGSKERLVLQWLLGPRLAPMVVPSKLPGQHHESWSKALLAAPWSGPAPVDSEARSALRAKQGDAGWRAIGRIAVTAATVPRQRQLLSAVLGAVGSTEAPGVRLGARRENPDRLTSVRAPWRWPLALNVSELAVVSSWPVGKTSELPVRTVGSRPLPPARSLPPKGRVIGRSTWSGAVRPVALSSDDSLRHLHVLGPTGVGKSTLLLNLITQDLHRGRAVVVIEPKGDLIADVLRRVPDKRLGDVVLLDPTDDARPVGLNPLATNGRSPELVADSLLAVFHSLYLSSWGPRTQDILHASLLTLARSDAATLVALPLLLGDPAFRGRLVAKVNDPIALGPFWAGFEAWSEAERVAAIAPVMNKLRPFIMRSNLRRVIGQLHPKFDVRQVFTERKILLVNLTKGRLGPEAASLLGSLVVAQLWQATLERAGIDPARRHPVFVYFDEFQDYLHLPTDLSDALAEARGLGVGLTLAHQHLHQLEPGMRSAVLANARSRVCFQLGHEDARVIAAGTTQLDPEDFQSLNGFEVYASLMADSAVQPWCSLRTDPPSPATTDPAVARSASRQQYGSDRQAIDAELEALLHGPRRTHTNDLVPRRRPPGGRP